MDKKELVRIIKGLVYTIESLDLISEFSPCTDEKTGLNIIDLARKAIGECQYDTKDGYFFAPIGKYKMGDVVPGMGIVNNVR